MMFLEHQDHVVIESQIDLTSLACQLARNLNHDDLFRLIVMVDGYAADYDFTLKLRDQMIEEIEKEDGRE